MYYYNFTHESSCYIVGPAWWAMAPWVFRPIAQVEDPGHRGGGRQRLPVASCLMPDARSSRCRSSTTSSNKCPLRTTPLFREKYQLAALLLFSLRGWVQRLYSQGSLVPSQSIHG